MRGAGLVTVKYLGTEENTADLFTKILDRQPFEKHRKTVLNAAANDGVPSARDKKAIGAWPRRFSKNRGGSEAQPIIRVCSTVL